MELIKAQGRLMAIGGGEDKEKDCLILKEFVRLAGNGKARVIVMTTATDSLEDVIFCFVVISVLSKFMIYQKIRYRKN